MDWKPATRSGGALTLLKVGLLTVGLLTASFAHQAAAKSDGWHLIMLQGQQALNEHLYDKASVLFVKAFELLNRSNTDDPRVASNWRYLGDAYMGLRRWNDARDCYLQEISIFEPYSRSFPSLAYDYYQLADIELALKQNEKTLASIETAWSIRKDNLAPQNPTTTSIVCRLSIIRCIARDLQYARKTIDLLQQTTRADQRLLPHLLTEASISTREAYIDVPPEKREQLKELSCLFMDKAVEVATRRHDTPTSYQQYMEAVHNYIYLYLKTPKANDAFERSIAAVLADPQLRRTGARSVARWACAMLTCHHISVSRALAVCASIESIFPRIEGESDRALLRFEESLYKSIFLYEAGSKSSTKFRQEVANLLSTEALQERREEVDLILEDAAYACAALFNESRAQFWCDCIKEQPRRLKASISCCGILADTCIAKHDRPRELYFRQRALKLMESNAALSHELRWLYLVHLHKIVCMYFAEGNLPQGLSTLQRLSQLETRFNRTSEPYKQTQWDTYANQLLSTATMAIDKNELDTASKILATAKDFADLHTNLKRG